MIRFTELRMNPPSDGTRIGTHAHLCRYRYAFVMQTGWRPTKLADKHQTSFRSHKLLGQHQAGFVSSREVAWLLVQCNRYVI